LRTKSITAAFVSALGDILSQRIESTVAQEVFRLNWIRLGGFFLTGLFYVGPFVHSWYEQLWKIGRYCERKYKASKLSQALVQLVTDQTIGVAIFFPSYFYVYEVLESLVAWRGE